MTRYLIGTGTARSGTLSLATLLNGCEGVNVGHEKSLHHMPSWDGEKRFEPLCEWLEGREGQVVGDVAFWHVNVLDRLLTRYSGLRAIGLIRPERETVRSCMRRLDRRYLTGDTHHAYAAIPNTDGSAREGYRRYWHAALQRLLTAKAQYPDRVLLTPPEVMNTRAGQAHLFAFAGIAEKHRRYLSECHYNSDGPYHD